MTQEEKIEVVKLMKEHQSLMDKVLTKTLDILKIAKDLGEELEKNNKFNEEQRKKLREMGNNE